MFQEENEPDYGAITDTSPSPGWRHTQAPIDFEEVRHVLHGKVTETLPYLGLSVRVSLRLSLSMTLI